MFTLQRYFGLVHPKKEAREQDDTPRNQLGTTAFAAQDLVFVCIDLEAYEHDHRKITEVGIAILDTRKLTAPKTSITGSLIAPGDGGVVWNNSIQASHLRVSENFNLVNKSFITGCPENFNFGTTSVLPQARIKTYLKHVLTTGELPPSNKTASTRATTPSKPRRIILVGHNLSADLSYLRTLDIPGRTLDNLSMVDNNVDTQRLASSKKHPIALSRLLMALDMPHEHLHNAGNDATYTLQAMVAMTVLDWLSADQVSRKVAAYREKVASGEIVAPKKKKRYRDLKTDARKGDEGRKKFSSKRRPKSNAASGSNGKIESSDPSSSAAGKPEVEIEGKAAEDEKKVAHGEKTPG